MADNPRVWSRRPSHVLLALVALFTGGACSFMTGYDGLEHGEHPDAGAEAAAPALDAGARTDGSAIMDAAAEDGSAVVKCTPSGLYCGGDKVQGKATNLYRCNAQGNGETLVEACTKGCVIVPNQDDHCA